MKTLVNLSSLFLGLVLFTFCPAQPKNFLAKGASKEALEMLDRTIWYRKISTTTPLLLTLLVQTKKQCQTAFWTMDTPLVTRKWSERQEISSRQRPLLPKNIRHVSGLVAYRYLI